MQGLPEREGEREREKERERERPSGNKAREGYGRSEDSPGSPDSLESVLRRAHIQPADESTRLFRALIYRRRDRPARGESARGWDELISRMGEAGTPRSTSDRRPICPSLERFECFTCVGGRGGGNPAYRLRRPSHRPQRSGAGFLRLGMPRTCPGPLATRRAPGPSPVARVFSRSFFSGRTRCRRARVYTRTDTRAGTCCIYFNAYARLRLYAFKI